MEERTNLIGRKDLPDGKMRILKTQAVETDGKMVEVNRKKDGSPTGNQLISVV